MKIGSVKAFDSLPDSLTAQRLTLDSGDAAILRLPEADRSSAAETPFVPTRMARFVALWRYNPNWICPGFGQSAADFARLQPGKEDATREIVFLLWQRDDDRYGVILPLVDGDLRAVFQGSDQGLRLAFTGQASGEASRVVAAAVGGDPYRLIQDLIGAVARELGTFRVRDEKAVPEFVDYLGWCTWDAFYKEVDAKKVLQGLESFRKGGVVPRFLLLDDGWQDTRDNRLASVRANDEKFPEGLGGLIARCKEKYGVRTFGVWHTLMGYWDGFHPEGEIAGEFGTEERAGGSGSKDVRTLVHRDEVFRFYQTFYSYLRSQGVDMTKVDNQNSLRGMAATGEVSVANMRSYQWAMQGAAHTHLRGNLLHCMCNDNDVAYHMAGSVVWRNSDDFFPRIPESHVFHVHANAMNNLWTGAFSLPDWDMFQSGHEAGPFHAAARAISGGPVYVSDKPGQHGFDLLARLVTSDGRLLRCDGPAQPTRDCLFTDCYRQPNLLKVCNRNGSIGVLGLFHCYHVGKDQQAPPVGGRFCPDDVLDLEGSLFAVYLHEAGTLSVRKRRQAQQIELPPMGFEIATVSPIQEGVAALGLLEKLNGSRAVESAGFVCEGTYEAHLRDGGRIGFYCEKEPGAVLVSGRASKYSYDADSGLLEIPRAAGRPLVVTLRW